MSAAELPAHPIQRAKLRFPRLGAGLVPRPRLIARLGRALQVPLTLLSAPAGFGKTTLLVEWASVLSDRPAWLTVDTGDRELSRFTAHVVAALTPVVPSPSDMEAVLDLVQRPHPASAFEVGTYLSEALIDLSRDALLVVDDYHLAASVEVENFVGGLLQFMPPMFHLMLSTRNDPSLPLARMRLHDQIVEIRGEELRFTDDEARVFLVAARGGADDPALATLLRQTTGGWAAGLRLASLALPVSDDPTRIAGAITGDQHLMDFLVEEVLAKQPAEIQNFLLCTAIVDRVCASLADALLDDMPQGGSRALLMTLAQGSFFFEAESDDGVWFRHHPLFHSLLRHQLEAHVPVSALQALHARASDWFGAHGLIDDAIRHRPAAGDATSAAALVEQHVQTALNREDWPSLATWLEMLPPTMINENPDLLLARAWVSHLSGRFEPVRETLKEVVTLLDREGGDPGRAASLRAECDTLIAVQLLTVDEDPAAVSKAGDAVERVLVDHRFGRGLAYVSYGLALQTAGQTEQAVRWLTAIAERESDRIDAGSIRALMGLAFVHRQAGHYAACREVAGHMLALAERHGLPISAGWARWFLGWIAYEANELETAIAHFTAITANRQRLHLNSVYEGMFGLMLAYQASGKHFEVTAMLSQLIEMVLEYRSLAHLPSIRLFEVRLALLRGDRQSALAAMNSFDVSLEGNSLATFEHEVISWVKLLLAEGSAESLTTAWREVERLRVAAENGHHRARLVEILALAALVCAARGERGEALAYLARSVALGEPAGFCRTYVDLGPDIVPLLERLVDQGVQVSYLQRLLAVIMAKTPDEQGQDEPAVEPAVTAAPAHVLELLTIREAEVLNGLCRRLSYQEIAQELFISVHTVKSHTNHVYEKLGVANRRQLLARAESLGLTV